MEIILFTDGGSRGNPGPAAIAAVIKSHQGKLLKEIGKYIGVSTNNDAEYKALIEGLTGAITFKPSQVDCYLDSELVVKQLTNQYKVKNENIKTLWAKVKELEFKIGNVSYHHIRREKNKEADALVNKVLDSTLKNGA
jgi:ribonuclease HI